MPKRKVRRTYSAKKHSSSRKARYLTIVAIASLVLVGIVLGYSLKDTKTLGVTTYLAKGDDGSSDNSGSGSSGSGSSGSGGSSSGSNNSDDNDEREDNDNSGSSGSSNTGSSNTGSSGSSGNSGRGSLFNIFPRRSITPQPTEIEDDEDEEANEIEVEDELEEELPDEPIEVITKDDRTRIDITANGIKVRLERRADRVVIKAEREDGTEVELADDTLFKIDDRLAKSNIKVETAGDNEFLVLRNTTGALTNFPISLDLATNALIINTTAGQKTVAILPDIAVQNLLAANIIDQLGNQALQNEVSNNTLPKIDRLITLGEQNGIPIYEINGFDNQRLLGLIPVIVEKDVTVSAETGEVVATQESLVNRVLDLVSF
ncbi:MAG: hypothetical protein HY428_03115 [Candidatus Levybacteria bacterium]|nr:hypothetical protein [Candidatus Levybacteria bacterium]